MKFIIRLKHPGHEDQSVHGNWARQNGKKKRRVDDGVDDDEEDEIIDDKLEEEARSRDARAFLKKKRKLQLEKLERLARRREQLRKLRRG